MNPVLLLVELHKFYADFIWKFNLDGGLQHHPAGESGGVFLKHSYFAGNI